MLPAASADMIATVGRVLSGKPQVKLALVFGSVARGKARPDSDVDVAIDAGPDVDVLELAREISLAVGVEAHVVRLQDATIPLLDEIVRESVVAYQSYPNASAQWRSHALCTLETDRPWYARMRDSWLKHVARQGLSDGQP